MCVKRVKMKIVILGLTLWMKRTFTEFPIIRSLTIKREAKLSTQHKPRFKNTLSDKMSTYFKSVYLLWGFRVQAKKLALKTVIIKFCVAELMVGLVEFEEG